MTAKQQIRERIEAFSEQEAAETLRLLDRADPVARFFDDAPLEDEHISDEEEAAVQEAREEIARGETIPLDELLRDLGEWPIPIAGASRSRLALGATSSAWTHKSAAEF
jgi:hypothetical protein